MKIFKRIMAFIMFSVIAITSSISTSFASWNTGDSVKNIANSALETFETSIQNPVAYSTTTNKYYPKVETALSDTMNGGTCYVVPNTNPVVETTLVINDGVTLCLPYSFNVSNNNSISASIMPSTTEIPNLPTNVIDSSSNNVTTYRKNSLSMSNSADLIINQGGVLTIGGEFSTKGVVRYYCEVILCKGSHIDVYGTLNNYGYVKESPDDYVNSLNNEESVLNNSIDSERYVHVFNNGTIQSYINLWNAITGGAAINIIDADLCIFTIFDFASLQTFVSFDYGSSLLMYGVMTLGTQSVRESITCIAKKGSSSNVLFNMNQGSTLTVEYLPSNASQALYTNINTKSKYAVYGLVELGRLYVDATITQVDSSKFFLPISHKLSIFVCNGAEFKLPYRVKFMNGSSLYVSNGGKITVSSDVIFETVEAWNLVKNNATANKNLNYDYVGSDSKIVNNGTIEVTSSGHFGAFVEHNSNNHTGILDFTSAGSLSVTSKEGTGGGQITIDSSGYYFDGSQISVGNFITSNTYNALYNSSLDQKYYWNGVFNSTATLTIVCVNMGYRYPIQDFTLSVTGEEARNGASNASYDLPIGSTFKFSAERAADIEMVVNGVSVTYDTNATYTINSNSTITITPSQGVLIKPSVSISDSVVGTDSSNNNSGCGQAKWRVKEDATVLFNDIANNMPSLFVRVGHTYSIYCSSKGTGTNGTVNFTGEYYLKCNGVAQPKQSGWDPSSTEKTFTATADYYSIDYIFGGKPGGICVTENTLVTMANGSHKPIKDVKLGEMVKTWSFVDGAFVDRPIIWYETGIMEQANVVTVIFDDGSKVEAIWRQSFFDADLLDYVTIDSNNYHDFVGKRLLADVGGTSIGTKRVVDAYVETRDTEYYEIDTMYDYQYFANNVLTVEPTLHEHVWFEVTPEFKYDPVKMAADLELYGPLDYELVKDLVTYDQYLWWSGEYLAVPIGKGYFDLEYLINVIRQFINDNYEVA